MSTEPTKVDAVLPEASGDDVKVPAAPAAKPALKDRIADLNLSQRASAVGGRLADRMKAVQAAAPAASDLAGKVKAAAGSVRLDKLNRDTLKAGRDGLAAKVEALLKPRAADDPIHTPTAQNAEPGAKRDLHSSAPEELKTHGASDIEALKARVDEALRARAQVSTQIVPPGDAAAVSVTTEPVAIVLDASPQALPAPTTSRIKDGLSRLITRRPAVLPQTEPATAVTADREAVVGLPEVSTQRTTSVTQRTSRTTLAQAEARRPIFSLGLLATALTAGGVLHILTTFAIPAINTGSAFDRLKWQLEPNVMRVMPVDANGQTALPFLTADMRYAMCRYDLTQTSVQVTATLPSIGWSLALYTQQGDNFYAVPGQEGRIVTASFTINAAGDRLLLPVPGVRRSDTDAAQVTSPQREGLVVIRAPNKGSAYLPAVEAALKGATCRALPRR